METCVKEGRKKRETRVCEERRELEWSTYFEWLLYTYTDLACEAYKDTYVFISQVMHSTPFEVIVERDQNRVGTVLYWRRHFRDDTALNKDEPDLYGEDVSVFEILVDLAKILEFNISKCTDFTKTIPQCMFLLICNLGLDIYTDEYINRLRNKSERQFKQACDEIRNILDIFVYRKYGRHGIGSAFPVKRNFTNQKTAELWSQVGAYILENFFPKVLDARGD